MKKALFILISLLVCSFSAFAQTEEIDEILPLLSTNRVSLDYECTILNNNMPVNYSGHLIVEGGCFILKGNGLEIYCNGETRWTVDNKTKEVYIENADGLKEILAQRENMTELDITNLRKTPMTEDIDAYSFDVFSLEPAWIVTDLR